MSIRTRILAASLLACSTMTGVTSAALAQDAPEAATSVQTVEEDPRRIAENLAAMMAERYTFADTGARIAAALRAKTAAGAYDGLHGTELAKALKGDLLAAHSDNHFTVIYDDPATGSAQEQDPERIIRPKGPQRLDMELARWLAPGIAFVRYNLFAGTPEEMEATSKFLDDYGSAKVMIFDLRKHRGGGLGEIQTIMGRLLAQPARLVTMAVRKSLADIVGAPPSDDPTLRVVEGDPEFMLVENWAVPDATKPALKAKVYLLTSKSTGSASEHFALAMKVAGRGTLVGEATNGANHFGGVFPIGGGLSAFVPFGRTFDPRDGKDWEGTGVEPDLHSPAADALVTVLEREGLTEDAARKLSADVAPD